MMEGVLVLIGAVFMGVNCTTLSGELGSMVVVWSDIRLSPAVDNETND